MKLIGRIAFPLLLLILYFAVQHWFFRRDPVPSARMVCVFVLQPGVKPVSVPYRSGDIRRIDLTADLSNPFKDEGIELWRSKAAAQFSSTSLQLSGPTFVSASGSVTGLHFSYPTKRAAKDELRIATLDGRGKLDFNKRVAYVWFEHAEDKLDHPFGYACKVKKGLLVDGYFGTRFVPSQR